MTRRILATAFLLCFPCLGLLAEWEDFSVEMVSTGSELPQETRLFVTAIGRVEISTWPLDKPALFPLREVKGWLRKADLYALAQTLVKTCDFFGLPESVVPPEIMDMAMEYVTVTSGGRTYKIGGYAASMCAEYREVFVALKAIGTTISILSEEDAE